MVLGMPLDVHAAAVQAYRSLPKAEIRKHRIEGLPAGSHFERVDVSERFRSASFGHRTTLLVTPERSGEFYVEIGRSTNDPGGLFGPFRLPGPGPSKGTPPRSP